MPTLRKQLEEAQELAANWKKAAHAYRDEMFRQGRVERFKQETIRKLNEEEDALVDMVAIARAEALELLQENAALKRKVERLERKLNERGGS